MKRITCLLLAMLLCCAAVLSGLAEGDVPAEIIYLEPPLEEVTADPVESEVDEVEEIQLNGDGEGPEETEYDVDAPVLFERGADDEPQIVQTLTLDRTRAVLAPGKKLTLTPSWEPEDLTPEITYTSSKPSVAKVNEKGKVTAVKAGTAIITAAADGVVCAECAISVGKAPKKVKLSAATATLGLGDGLELTVTFDKGAADLVRFTSTDPAVIAVDEETGFVTAMGVGQATVTATASNGKEGSLALTVEPQATGIALEPAECALVPGKTAKLTLAFTGGAACPVYVSSDESVAIVSADGTVTAVAGGRATITATTVTGIGAGCRVSVCEAGVDNAPKLLMVDDTVELMLRHLPEDEPVTWSVTASDKKVVKPVETEGGWALRGVKAGKATITAQASTGATATFKVTVKKPASNIHLTVPSVVALGERIEVFAEDSKGTPASFTELETVGGNEGVLAIEGHTVEARARGWTRLRAKLFNGQWTDAVTVYVNPALTPENMEFRYGIDCKELRDASDWIFRDPESDTVVRVALGDYMQYKAGFYGSYEARSTDESVVKLSGDRIKFVGTGSASVVYTAYNGAEKYLNLEVLPAPKSVKLYADKTVKPMVEGGLIVVTDRGVWDEVDGRYDMGYDYLHMSLKMSGKDIVSATRPISNLTADNLPARFLILLSGGKKTGKAKLTCKLFNGVKDSVTVKSTENALKDINPKPDKQIIKRFEGGMGAYLKSMKYNPNGSLTAEFYFINGTDKKVSGGLDGINAVLGWFYLNEDGELATQDIDRYTMDKMKVSVGKKSSTVIKVTYGRSGLNQYMTWPYGRDLSVYGKESFYGYFATGSGG